MPGTSRNHDERAVPRASALAIADARPCREWMHGENSAMRGQGASITKPEPGSDAGLDLDARSGNCNGVELVVAEM